MKKVIFTMAITICFATTALISCKPSTKEGVVLDQKVQNAQHNVDNAKDSLVAAKKAATAEEWQSFKYNADSIMANNDAKIAEFRRKIKKTGNTMNVQYEKNIEALEQKNKELKLKMKTYKNDANEDWQSFKTEFNHDMTDLGQALKNFTVNNKN